MSKDLRRYSIPSQLWFELLRRIYRRTRLTLKLGERVRRLKEEIGPLPRTLGVRTRELDPTLDERIASLRDQDRQLVIGDFDQDGGIVSRFGPIAGVPTIESDRFMERLGSPVLLVDLNGRLGVRKQFVGPRGRFVQELEAMTQLERSGCPAPRVMDVDWQTPSITMTFVPGAVVREMLATAGANIRDRDSPGPYTREVDRERIEIGRAYVPQVLSREDVSRIAATLEAIHRAGFVLEDVKFGNIVLSGPGREPVYLDFERALPVRGLPPALANYLRAVDLRKFAEQFGDVPAPEVSP